MRVNTRGWRASERKDENSSEKGALNKEKRKNIQRAVTSLIRKIWTLHVDRSTGAPGTPSGTDGANMARRRSRADRADGSA